MSTSMIRGFACLLFLGAASCGSGDTGGQGGAGGAGSGAQGSTSGAQSSTSGAGGAATSGSAATTSSSSGGLPGVPPFGGSSGGTGGPVPVNGTPVQAGGVTYNLIVPSTYKPGVPTAFLLVYSGVEGGQQMTTNLQMVASFTGTDGFIRAVLDGKLYNGNGNAGATVLDDVRAKYDVDNDRTYLLGESAGTSAAEKLGFTIRQPYFAAYWANDVNAVAATPAQNAGALGFAPWGQVGPGGAQAIAQQIVAAMQGAGYRLPSPAPYAGAGANTHGDPQQFIAAVSWFPGKTRQ